MGLKHHRIAAQKIVCRCKVDGLRLSTQALKFNTCLGGLGGQQGVVFVGVNSELGVYTVLKNGHLDPVAVLREILAPFGSFDRFIGVGLFKLCAIGLPRLGIACG